MFVYLKCKNSIKRIPNVTLHECAKPKVGEVSEERIDPALWYKVLVLDSVLVDCDFRCIFWNTDKLHGESDYIHSCSAENLNVETVVSFFKDKEKLFEDGECYDYDPTVDELFETANKIFSHLSLDVFDREGNAPTYSNLLKMLHVFILPKIKFRNADRDSVSTVLNWIEHQHENTEAQIQKRDTTKRNTENSLRKQRSSFLKTEDFTSFRYVSSLDEEFLAIFLQHLEKDIRKSNENLVGLDRDISPLRNSASERDLQKLMQKRSERDSVYEILQNGMVAREEILNVISRKHVKRKSNKKTKRMSSRPADLHTLYVEISERLQQINKEIQDLINTKIKISSVREAVLLTLNEINLDGESYGYNRKKGSFEMETDLFDPTKKPEEWATLQEKVKLLLQVKQIGFRPKFEKFCGLMRLKCQKLYDESKLFSLGASEVIPEESEEPGGPVSPTTSKMLNVLGSESRRRRSTRIFPSEPSSSKESIPKPKIPPYTSRWSIGSISKKECEEICHEITEHISEMAYHISVELLNVEEIAKTFHSKVYICYEEHVSSELMPVLNELYEQSYRDQCYYLANWLCSICLSDFGFGEKKMVSLMNYVSSPVSSEESSRECSLDVNETFVKMPCPEMATDSKTATLGRRSIKDISLEELYTICDNQCESMPQSFIGALEIDNHDTAGTGSSENESEQTTQKYLEMKKEENLLIDHANDIGIELAADAGSSEEDDSLPMISEVSIRKTVISGINSSPAETFPNGATNLEMVINDVETGTELPPPYSEVVTMRGKQRPPPAYSTLPPIKDKFYKAFKDFESFICDEDHACTLFSKLRQMSRAIRYIEAQITKLRNETGENSMVCADDLVDIVILLLCRLDARLLLKLYAHMNLMIHLSPMFMQGNAHDYALVTFNVAYQHLFEQQVLHRSPDSTCTYISKDYARS